MLEYNDYEGLPWQALAPENTMGGAGGPVPDYAGEVSPQALLAQAFELTPERSHDRSGPS